MCLGLHDQGQTELVDRCWLRRRKRRLYVCREEDCMRTLLTLVPAAVGLLITLIIFVILPMVAQAFVSFTPSL